MLFKASAPAAPAGDMVIARLNVRAQPLDRGEVFEDPLDEMLQATAMGRVTGGGMLGEEGEIESCDLEITLPEATDAAIGALRRALEGLGAPRGSKLIWNDGANELAFGTCEGLAVYLNGTDLPDSVYEECDLDVVYEELGRLVGSEGRSSATGRARRRPRSISTGRPRTRCWPASARSSTPTHSAGRPGSSSSSDRSSTVGSRTAQGSYGDTIRIFGVNNATPGAFLRHFRPQNDAETTPMRHRFGPKRQSNRGDGEKARGRRRLV